MTAPPHYPSGMTAVDDDTARLIRDLDDPAKFVRRPRVAVFMPHQLVRPDGGVDVDVSPADLEEIAANTNRDYQAHGKLTTITVGHRRTPKPGEVLDEKDQPPAVGYGRAYACEMVNRPKGPVLRLLYDEYFPVGQAGKPVQYPSRSAEYDPAAKVITNVALLTREPMLPLGTVRQYAAGRPTYAMRPVMADPMTEEPGMTGQAAAEWTPDDDAQYARHCKYMAKYEADKAMKAAPPVAVVDPTKPVEAAAYHARPDVTAKVDAVSVELERLKKDAVDARREATVTHSKAVLDRAKAAIAFDYARELGVLVKLPTTDEREQHVAYMLKHYEKLPTQDGFIRTIDTPPAPGTTPAAKPTGAKLLNFTDSGKAILARKGK